MEILILRTYVEPEESKSEDKSRQDFDLEFHLNFGVCFEDSINMVWLLILALVDFPNQFC